MKVNAKVLLLAVSLAVYACTGLADAPAGIQTDEPKALTPAEQAAFEKQLAADKAAAAAAINALKDQPPADLVKAAAEALEVYCRDILRLGFFNAPTNDKRDHCLTAMRFGDTLKQRTASLTDTPATPSMPDVQELETLLGSPRDVLARRFSQAKDLLNKGQYADASKLLSSFLGVPETGDQRPGRMLRALCYSKLDDSEATIRDLRRVVGKYEADPLSRRAAYFLGVYEMSMLQFGKAAEDLGAVAEHYTPSAESTRTAMLLTWLQKPPKPPAPQPKGGPQPPKSVPSVPEDDAGGGVSPEELNKIDRLRAGAKTSFADVEAKGLELLQQYKDAESQGKIYYTLAVTYANSGPVADKTIECSEKALACPLDSQKRLRLFVYWGDAGQVRSRFVRGAELTAVRRDSAEVYLRGIKEALTYDLPDNAPPIPSVGKGDFDVGSRMWREHTAQVEARKIARRQTELIRERDTLTGQVAYVYSRPPFDLDDARELATAILDDKPAVEKVMAAVEKLMQESIRSLLKRDLDVAELAKDIEPAAVPPHIAGGQAPSSAK